MQIFRDTAYETSIELSSEKGLSLILIGLDIPKVSSLRTYPKHFKIK